MPNITVVERDYTKVYEVHLARPELPRQGVGHSRTVYQVDDVYDQYLTNHRTEEWGGKRYPSLRADRDVCGDPAFAAETNGELAHRAYEVESRRDRYRPVPRARHAGVVYNFDDLCTSPRRTLTTPYWTGVTNGGRTYAAFCQNVEERIPWRTLTGRQHLYLDHEAYRPGGTCPPSSRARPTHHATWTTRASSRGPWC